MARPEAMVESVYIHSDGWLYGKCRYEIQHYLLLLTDLISYVCLKYALISFIIPECLGAW